MRPRSTIALSPDFLTNCLLRYSTDASRLWLDLEGTRPAQVLEIANLCIPDYVIPPLIRELSVLASHVIVNDTDYVAAHASSPLYSRSLMRSSGYRVRFYTRYCLMPHSLWQPKQGMLIELLEQRGQKKNKAQKGRKESASSVTQSIDSCAEVH